MKYGGCDEKEDCVKVGKKRILFHIWHTGSVHPARVMQVPPRRCRRACHANSEDRNQEGKLEWQKTAHVCLPTCGSGNDVAVALRNEAAILASNLCVHLSKHLEPGPDSDELNAARGNHGTIPVGDHGVRELQAFGHCRTYRRSCTTKCGRLRAAIGFRPCFSISFVRLSAYAPARLLSGQSIFSSSSSVLWPLQSIVGTFAGR
jgi:hypothetical protein